MQLLFTKMSGAGNDFIVIDDRKNKIARPKKLAKELCDRRLGIGADGLILLRKSKKAAYEMMYYNADGSYGGMCGNGGRCIANFAIGNGIAENAHFFESVGYIYEARKKAGNIIQLKMKNPDKIALNLSLDIEGRKINYHYIDTGAPHVIIESSSLGQELDDIRVHTIGSSVRYHQNFQPSGTNVNFIQQSGKTAIQIRTYERGVEAETLACGTGSVAAAIISSLILNRKSPIAVRVQSKANLMISFKKNRDVISDVYLTGPAAIVFTGTVNVSR
jgi:diaminopimelate epimerase